MEIPLGSCALVGYAFISFALPRPKATSMPKPSYQFAFAALILWLLASWGGAYAHLCFDGQEPPLSMHLQLQHMDELEHHPDEVHQDMDVEFLQTLIAKLSKIDLGLLLLAVLTLLLMPRHQQTISSRYQLLLPHKIPHTWPPLRAPPFTA
jgi:hypothetical protein